MLRRVFGKFRPSSLAVRAGRNVMRYDAWSSASRWLSGTQYRSFSLGSGAFPQDDQTLRLRSVRPPSDRTSLMFTVDDSPGALSDALGVFSKHGVNLTRIESRPGRTSGDYVFHVDMKGAADEPQIMGLVAELRLSYRDVTHVQSRKVPWFPHSIREMDKVADQILDAGDELQSDHPGFNDPTYRARRAELARIALEFRQGEQIPRIDYTQREVDTWGQVWRKLMPLQEKYACDEHNRMLRLCQDNCGYAEDNIPQAQDISDFLKDTSGFQLRPVAGLLSARNFFYGLAFRIFFSTQYIRHHSKPLYTPEPDIIHELLGHAPLFADRTFADFSQQFGLASIGATDDQILALARIYWFTIEFGMCKGENGERKAFGAGLLSSFGELEYAMSDKPDVLPWDPQVAASTDYPITEYQPTYFLADSFTQAKESLEEYTEQLAKPLRVCYDPYTQRISVDANVEREAL